jgi:hypothetical protein
LKIPKRKRNLHEFENNLIHRNDTVALKIIDEVVFAKEENFPFIWMTN